MAQIKKFQNPAGTIAEESTGSTTTTTTPQQAKTEYGRLIQNGTAIQATEDMIGWLNKQGYYGEQMASKLRRGEDQYLDIDDQGVGIIRSINVENEDLNKRQQKRTTHVSRRIEGRRLTDARNAIQRLATYDYSKFSKEPIKLKAYE